MISYLNGTILHKRGSSLILDVQGVGYTVFVGKELYDKPVGSKLVIFIYQHIREDTNALYGLSTAAHLDLFEMLLTVQGVGPKVGLSILDLAPLPKLTQAIVGKDDVFLSSVPGIGKKTAAKIILELSSKISTISSGDPSSYQAPQTQSLIDALTTLGYNMGEIRFVLATIPADAPLEQQVKQALGILQKGR